MEGEDGWDVQPVFGLGNSGEGGQGGQDHSFVLSSLPPYCCQVVDGREGGREEFCLGLGKDDGKE